MRRNRPRPSHTRHGPNLPPQAGGSSLAHVPLYSTAARGCPSHSCKHPGKKPGQGLGASHAGDAPVHPSPASMSYRAMPRAQHTLAPLDTVYLGQLLPAGAAAQGRWRVQGLTSIKAQGGARHPSWLGQGEKPAWEAAGQPRGLAVSTEGNRDLGERAWPWEKSQDAWVLPLAPRGERGCVWGGAFLRAPRGHAEGASEGPGRSQAPPRMHWPPGGLWVRAPTPSCQGHRAQHVPQAPDGGWDANRPPGRAGPCSGANDPRRGRAGAYPGVWGMLGGRGCALRPGPPHATRPHPRAEPRQGPLGEATGPGAGVRAGPWGARSPALPPGARLPPQQVGPVVQPPAPALHQAPCEQSGPEATERPPSPPLRSHSGPPTPRPRPPLAQRRLRAHTPMRSRTGAEMPGGGGWEGRQRGTPFSTPPNPERNRTETGAEMEPQQHRVGRGGSQRGAKGEDTGAPYTPPIRSGTGAEMEARGAPGRAGWGGGMGGPG